MSNNKLPRELKDRVIKLYGERYKGFGPTLAAEKLFEINKIKISDETLRNWLVESGDWKKVRRVREHRQWRDKLIFTNGSDQIISIDLEKDVSGNYGINQSPTVITDGFSPVIYNKQ